MESLGGDQSPRRSAFYGFRCIRVSAHHLRYVRDTCGVCSLRGVVFLRLFPYSDIPLPEVQQLFHSEILVVAEYFRAQMRSLRFEVI